MTDEYIKLPRLYVDGALQKGLAVQLSAAQAHYLRNVLRRAPGDGLRLFNGRDGEWQASLKALDKKTATALPENQTKPQPPQRPAVHLLFAPIKKQRMDFLIEKAVELGVTDLHPVLTAHTEVRKINTERLQAQILEAAEQCERLSLPTLHSLVQLPEKLTGWPQDITLYACIERLDAPVLASKPMDKAIAFLIGPEGGFDGPEIKTCEKYGFIEPVSLGSGILRAETAALKCLSLLPG